MFLLRILRSSHVHGRCGPGPPRSSAGPRTGVTRDVDHIGGTGIFPGGGPAGEIFPAGPVRKVRTGWYVWVRSGDPNVVVRSGESNVLVRSVDLNVLVRSGDPNVLVRSGHPDVLVRSGEPNVLLRSGDLNVLPRPVIKRLALPPWRPQY